MLQVGSRHKPPPPEALLTCRVLPWLLDAAGLRAGTITPGATNTYTKSFGLVIVPMFSKSQQTTARKIQNVVDIIFRDGEAAVSTIKR